MATDLRTSNDLLPPADDPDGTNLNLFRFSLRKLLVVFALATLLIATTATSHGLTAAVVMLAALVVTLHLLSTAIGTQLRSHADRQIESRSLHRPGHVSDARTNSSPEQSRSPWHERRNTPLPWLYRLVTATVVLGAVAGVILLSGAIGHRSSPVGILVGSLSTAVLGGWIAFVGYSFYSVFRDGIRDAMAKDRRDHER
jgi:hypothetical protein